MFAKLCHYDKELDNLLPADYAERPAAIADSWGFWFSSLTILVISAISIRLLML